MLKLPLRKLFFIVKLCFLFVLVLITLSLFEYWRGGKRATRAVILDPEEDEYERQILEDEARIVPGLGEGGRAAYLTGEDKRLGEEAEKKYAVNTYLSDRIAYNRTLRDFRNPACERVTYDAELPSASVIIIFHNEPYSVVVRTIWSVLNTARRDQPWHRRANYLESGTGRVMKLGYPGQPSDSEHVYLKEIILVDDNSTLPELRGKLARYIRTRLPEMVRMLRLPDRIGLTRARLAGARYASGEVLIFLDAHCEGVTDWMRPLLQRIKDSPTAVVIPIIDVIENKDFFYSVQDPAIFQGLMRARVTGARTARGDVLVFLDAHCEAEADWLRPLLQRLSHKRDAVVTPVIDVVDQTSFHLDGEDPIQVGGFTFVGHFTWIDVPEWEKKRRGSDIAPTWSPTMAGGLFAIRRSYYWELGAYDEQMAGWGGENLEMSFRIWQCGGTLETIPCSRVGHVFRSFHPYGLPAATDTHGINTARMAEVWMDEYAELFYLHRPDLRKNPIIGDVTHRKILREKLHCKSFQWFLDNVYKEKFVPVRDSRAYGRVQNPSSHLCLDTMQREGEASPLGFYPCHDTLTATQYLSLSLTGQLRDEERCAEVEFIRNRGSEQDDESLSRLVIMVGCKENTARSKWTYNERTQQLQHSDSGLCLDTRGARAGDDARAAPCARAAEPAQRWAIDYTTGAAGQKDKPSLLPVELEDRLRKLGRQRRKSRSLLSAETNANESGEVPPHSGDSSPPGEARQRARLGKHKHKSRSKKKPKKKVKNKFIVTVERELENHTVEHLEMDIHCQHKRLYPNNSFVRDLVTILNDRNIRVINNGRVFEKNRVTELGRKDPYAVHLKEKEADTPPPEPEDDAPIETTEAPTSPPQHILTPPAPASAPAPAPPKHSHPMLQPFAEVTTPHAAETRRPSKKRHRKKSKRTKEPPRLVYPQSDERADSLEDSPMVLRERGGDASDFHVSIGRVNGSSARLGSLERERETAHARDSQAYPKRRPTEPDFIRPLDSDTDLRYMEDHARGHLKAGAEHGFKEVKLERPRKKEKRRGKTRGQVLSDIQGRVLEPAEDLLRRDHWSGLKEKPGPDIQDWTKDTDIQGLHDLSIKDKDEDIIDVRESERDTPKRSKVWKGRQDPHDAVESFVFKDVWNEPEPKEARAGTHFGPKVTELAREVLKDYDEMHPRAVSEEAETDKQALRVLLKSNVTFNLGDELLNWRRSKDNELMIPSGSEASDSASDESPAV